MRKLSQQNLRDNRDQEYDNVEQKNRSFHVDNSTASIRY